MIVVCVLLIFVVERTHPYPPTLSASVSLQVPLTVLTLQIMAEHDVSALPVVGIDGTVVGVFSSSEVRNMLRRHGASSWSLL
jgi:hypothetical protein